MKFKEYITNDGYIINDKDLRTAKAIFINNDIKALIQDYSSARTIGDYVYTVSEIKALNEAGLIIVGIKIIGDNKFYGIIEPDY